MFGNIGNMTSYHPDERMCFDVLNWELRWLISEKCTSQLLGK